MIRRMTPMVLVWCGLGCRSGSIGDGTLIVTEVDTVVTQASGLLAGPSELTVLDDGRLLVTDARANALLLFTSNGELVRTIGGPGAGPGEFQFPRSTVVINDTIRVLDAGNGRIHDLALEGTLLSSRSMPPGAESGAVTFLHEGGYLVSRNGRDSALVQRYTAAGEPGSRFGVPVVTAPEFWHFPTVKGLINEGTVPPHLRNMTISVADSQGTWLILSAEGVVQRFGLLDRLAWEVALADPAFVTIKEDFFARNQGEANPSVLFPLLYIVDASAHAGTLWLLLGPVEGQGTTLIALGADGSVEQRVRLPDVEGVRQFAVTGGGEGLYLIDFDDAMLLFAELK